MLLSHIGRSEITNGILMHLFVKVSLLNDLTQHWSTLLKIRHLWQLEIFFLSHSCLIRPVPLPVEVQLIN
jgi:hypothetical protein